MRGFESWGRFPDAPPSCVFPLFFRDELGSGATTLQDNGSLLPFGLGRSYGDSCLNGGGTLLSTRGLSRYIALDEEKGILACEAGASFDEILRLIVPRGFFLPVSPGTRFVTVGGAIANDVHGKNHHVAGTFGCHVTRFELWRSDGSLRICSPTENADLFRATIGGLGLTGLITWAEFRLRRIKGPLLNVEEIRFRSLDEFFALDSQSGQDFEYTVSWIDCLATGRKLGRGVFIRGNHAESSDPRVHKPRVLRVPLDVPALLLNRVTMSMFNGAFYWAHVPKTRRRLSHYEPFFYPLDAILDWNRLYGKPGFLQYQCVVPEGGGDTAADSHAAIREILDRIARSGFGSFLSVLKRFGNIASPGLMSFPKSGVTLALDFAFQGLKTLRLLEELDAVVRKSGGSVYPAKDARMSKESFAAFFPAHREFERFVDPRFSSSFWRRVTGPQG